VQLFDERYRHVLNSDDPAAETIVEVYRVWQKNFSKWYDPNTRSSHLYDTMAVRMAWDTSGIRLDDLRMRVTDDGCTVLDRENGHEVTVARAWGSEEALSDFKTELVERITGSLPESGVRLRVVAATASVDAEGARRALTDGAVHDMKEAWAAERTDKKPQWFQLELARQSEVRLLKIAFKHGDRWPEKVEIRSSRDGREWRTLLKTTNTTRTRGFKRFEVEPTEAKLLRVVVKGHGTWHATLVSGVRVYGFAEGGAPTASKGG
jgi:hypothetical protein